MTNNSTSAAQIVNVDLDRSDNNSAIEVGELVQHRCYEQLVHQIDNDLSRAMSALAKPETACCLAEDEKYPPGSGLVYFIDGTRGAGKSTFLQAAFKALPETFNKSSDQRQVVLRLARLAYIDPSRIEDNEIVLLGVLKALAEMIDLRVRSCIKMCEEPVHRKFRDAFRKLAGGLSLFAKDYHQLRHLDPELFLDHGLERAGHSKDLRRNLHVLLDTVCEMIGVDALLIAFDDADTKSTHARAVLECIRSYLDTPRLVVLVTGDMELHSLLVRDKFSDYLGRNSFKESEDRIQQRVRMIDHLEDQYLLKLFPIRRRIQLRPLWSLLETDTTKYQFVHTNWKEPRNPIIVVNEIIRRGLRIKNGNDIKLYREFLLKQPLRSVLQVLSRCAPYLEESDDAGKKSIRWTIPKGESKEDLSLSNALREGLRSLALGKLYKFGVEVDAIAAHELPALIDAVFDLSLRDGDLDTAAYLRPRSSDDDLKLCFIALAAEAAGFCVQNPAAMLRYMFSGVGSVSLFGQVLLRKGRGDNKDTLDKQFRRYIGIGRQEDALDWARHATAVLIAPGVRSSAIVRFGVVGLYMKAPKIAKSVQSEFSDFSTIKKAIAQWLQPIPRPRHAGIMYKTQEDLPVFALSLLEVSGSGNRTYASIFNILGLLERLLDLEPNQRGEYEVLSILYKAYPSVSISCPEWEGDSSLYKEDGEEEALTNTQEIKGNGSEDGVVTENGSSNDEDESVAEAPEYLSALASNLNRWLIATRYLRGQLAPSAVLLGKIWMRLYFSLEKVSEDRRGKISTASLMEIFALCVINAFYVEEADHHVMVSDGTLSMDGALNRTNPLASTNSFYKKLENQIVPALDKLPLTSVIASCPLLLGLLHPIEAKQSVKALLQRLGQERIGVYWQQETDDLLCRPGAWNLIEKTYIHGGTKKAPTLQLASA